MKARARLSLLVPLLSTLLLVGSDALSQQQADETWAPWVTKTTEHGATINWQGASTATGSVDYATSAYYDKNKGFEKTVTSKVKAAYQHVQLTDLVPGTPYVYRVRPSGSTPAFANRAFKTMPLKGPFTFIVISDTQEGHTYTEAMRFKYVADAVAKETDALFVLHGGDYAGHDSSGLWGKYFAVADPMLAKMAIFPTIGNHEYHSSASSDPDTVTEAVGDGSGPTTAVNFHSAYDTDVTYSFDVAGVQFIVLASPDPAACVDTDDPHPSLALTEKQVPFLQEKLTSPRLGTFTIHHHPIWDYGRNNTDAALDPWSTLYQTYGISATFAGHTHNYQRYSVQGIPYFVVGNAGGRFSDLIEGQPFAPWYVLGQTRNLGYLRVRVDPDAGTAKAEEVFAAFVLEDDSPETPQVYDPPKVFDTVSFPLLPTPAPPVDPSKLLLQSAKVSVGLTWKDPYTGKAGKGTAVQKGDVYGYFFITDAGNPEVFVKVLEPASSKPYLLLWGGLTDFEYTVTFTNTSNGKSYSATKPAYSAAGGADATDLPQVRAVSWDPETGIAAETTQGGSLGVEAEVERLRAPRSAGLPEPSAGSDLLLAGGQVSVSVAWWSPYSGQSGIATALPQGDQFGFFSFGSPVSPEVFVKVLDWGTAQPFLLFAAGLTDFEYAVTYRNVKTGQKVVFSKPAGGYQGYLDGKSMAH